MLVANGVGGASGLSTSSSETLCARQCKHNQTRCGDHKTWSVNQSWCNARGSRSGGQKQQLQNRQTRFECPITLHLPHLRHEARATTSNKPALKWPTYLGQKKSTHIERNRPENSDARFGSRVNLKSHCPAAKRLITQLSQTSTGHQGDRLHWKTAAQKVRSVRRSTARKQIPGGINLSINWQSGKSGIQLKNTTKSKKQKHKATRKNAEIICTYWHLIRVPFSKSVCLAKLVICVANQCGECRVLSARRTYNSPRIKPNNIYNLSNHNRNQNQSQNCRRRVWNECQLTR